MPALYAHYRFGLEILPQMPPETQKTVSRFRRLYDVGLHGPDLFFNYSPGFHTTIGDLGSLYHHQTGHQFFGRVCRMLQLSPSEAGYAYLYGLLAHYCLDTICHPFIDATDAQGNIGHTELEAEFDRFLMALDGKPVPSRYDGTRHLKLTRGECQTAAEFYPPAKGTHVEACLQRMRLFTKLMNQPDGFRRNAVDKVTEKMGKSIHGLLMSGVENTHCSMLDDHLLSLYQKAVHTYPVMLQQIGDHLDHNTPLGSEFDLDFG